MRDAAATRARIMAAATDEFATHGIAGARIDRVAAAAATSKAQIYSYVGNKETLFDAVFTEHVLGNVGAVPFTAADLPGYAARLYDAYLDDPALVRLVTWARLERTPTGGLFGSLAHHDEANLQAIAEAQRTGLLVEGLEPADLWAMLISLASTWAQASIVHAADAGEPRETHDRRRTALAAATRRAFCRDVG